jgi:dihydrofolate reductase
MIRLIAAIDRKRGIAKGGVQPWKISVDEEYFKDKTHQFGGNILMGRKTFEVIGHPLPSRRNFVVSHDENADIEGVEMVRDLQDFLVNFHEDLWVIGGASIFEQVLLKAEELYLTLIDADFGCDQFFPEYESQFELVDTSALHEENGFIFTYHVYKNRNIATN